jgi:UDP-N-acetylmuramate: L-alanyl-gamma-D-glutamyl-meso-diaminopimelate ligase
LKVHFIGIGGTGMGALACLLRADGHEVRGSDGPLYPPMSTQLARAGIPVAEGFAAENLAWGPERVVVGNVCRADHPEVVEAQRRGLPLDSFPSLLAATLLEGRRSLVVGGTHGKTTTSSIVAWLLTVAGRDPSWLIGGVPLNLGGGAHVGGGEAFVLEGDEYDTAFFDRGSKFLHYRPRRAILTSLEYDHADIFADLEQLRAAFRRFVALIPEDGDLVANLDDSEVMGIAAGARCRVTTYRVLSAKDGDVRSADWVARVASGPHVRRIAFEVFEHGASLGMFTSSLIGLYNVGNLLAGVALARLEGVDIEALRTGVARFRGVRRRQELVGVAQGVRVIEDFAHHPTAVRLTVAAIRRRWPAQALHVCFEPRSSSSRRSVFFDGYAAAFEAASAVYIAPVFAPEKVPAGTLLDTTALARAIAERGVPARAFSQIADLARAVLEAATPGDTILTLSSGSFGGLPRIVLDELGDAVTFAGPEDVPGIDALLAGYGLPAVRDAQEVDSLVIRGASGPIGCVNLQVAGEDAYLFGLAVAAERRGEGLGWVLADSMIRRARTLGVRRICLLPRDTADFFAGKLGFSVVPCSALRGDVVGIGNFVADRRGLAGDPLCMVLELSPEPSLSPAP